jgi:hypothetical protein
LNPPSGLTIDADGIIAWTPSFSQHPGSNLVTTVVSNTNPYDLVNPQLSATNRFTVVVRSPPVITLAATNLVLESCAPTNNALDPGETVTFLFGLRNTGAIDTVDLVGTLLATNGIDGPSGPQTYGVLLAGGTTVSQPFSFTANGACGSNITAMLQLQDGPLDLGTISIPFVLGRPLNIFTQYFDTVTAPALPSGWTSSSSNSATAWFTTNTLADTAPNAAFSADANDIGVNELVSPPIALPVGAAQLTFQSRYSLECDPDFPTNAYDAGVLEIKIGSNPFIDITNAGGVFLSGGYNAKVSVLYTNPLSGRWGWSGTNGGYTTTTVNLPASASGQTIQLRWRCGSDNGGVSGSGWRIDSVAVTGWGCCANTAPFLPAQSDRTVNELELMTVTNTATDAESPPQVLSYALLAGPTNAAISTNGIITWTPSQVQSPSTNTFTTVVSDGGSPPLSATNTFNVVVREVNLAPSLPILTNYTISELTLLRVTNTATNANIHSTIAGYTLLNPPAGAAIDANGVITWTPSQTQSPGTNIVTTVVSNTNPYDLINPQLGATNSFTVVVNPTEEIPPPTIESISFADGMVVITWSSVTGQTYRLQYSALGVATSWTDIPPDVTATGSTISVTNTTEGSALRFYRVVLLP